MTIVESSKPHQPGDSIEGIIRINKRNYKDSYVSCPNGGVDILIQGRDRANAFNGDYVVVKIKKTSEWKINHNAIIDNWDQWSRELEPIIANLRTDGCLNADNVNIPSNLPQEIAFLTVLDVLKLPFSISCIQKTGIVVTISHDQRPKLAGGFLKPFNKTLALLTPTDSRVPRILIPIQQCPADLHSAGRRYEKVMFGAEIVSWQDQYARGNLIKILGDCQSIKTRVEALLLKNNIEDCDFPPELYEDLSDMNTLAQNWYVHPDEYKYRRDFSNECVFTIDPLTARDLDDALSVKLISSEPELYEVGVHIADVSYFVQEFTRIDFEARKRATSVYLVDKVIPMLPRVLCEQLCSLNPGTPRLTFSVVWKMTAEGEIRDVWFGRTIIESCVKLAYEHAQDIIDTNGDLSWIEEGKNMPPIHNNRFGYRQIAASILKLNQIAKNLRAKRFESGALKIDKLQLSFTLDQETGFPIGFSTLVRTPAKSLIEEFMLLANMAVAAKIYQDHPDIALLRRHPAPDTRLLTELKRFCEVNNIYLDTSSSKAIEDSLAKIRDGDDNISRVVSQLLLNSMKAAEYFCTGSFEDIQKFHHYGLGVLFYTHFTSPIRRYPDLIVHRLLAVSLDYAPSVCEDTQSVINLTKECNDRKTAAKDVSDESARIYYYAFIKNCGPIETLVAVKKIGSKSFDAMLTDCEAPVRVYLDKLTNRELASVSFESHCGVRQLVLEWRTADELKALETEKKSPEVKKQNNNKKHKRKSKVKQDVSVEKPDTCENELDNVSNGACSNGKTSEANDGPADVAMASASTEQSSTRRHRQRQTIGVFDLVRVSLSVDQDDFTQLKATLLAPTPR